MPKFLEYTSTKRTRVLLALAEQQERWRHRVYNTVDLYYDIYVVTPSGVSLRATKLVSAVAIHRKEQDEKMEGVGREGSPVGTEPNRADFTLSEIVGPAPGLTGPTSPTSDPSKPAMQSGTTGSDDSCINASPQSFRDLIEAEKTGDDTTGMAIIFTGLRCDSSDLPWPRKRLFGPIFVGATDHRGSKFPKNITVIPHLVTLGMSLGRGRTGVVQPLAIEGLPDTGLVMKLSAKNVHGWNVLTQATRELRVYRKLRNLQGTVVPRCYGLWRCETGDFVGLMFEHAGESLEHKTLSDTDKHAIYCHYKMLHKAGVTHGSAKPKHWFRARDGSIRLVDFGEAYLSEDGYYFEDEADGDMSLFRERSGHNVWSCPVCIEERQREKQTERNAANCASKTDVSPADESTNLEEPEEELTAPLPPMEADLGDMPANVDPKLVVNVEVMDVDSPVQGVKVGISE